MPPAGALPVALPGGTPPGGCTRRRRPTARGGGSAWPPRAGASGRGRPAHPPFDRITLTFPTLNAAAAVLFLVTGENKRAALRAVTQGTVPAARVRPVDGSLTWFLDATAAGE